MDLNRKTVEEMTTIEQKESRFKNIVPELFNSEGHVIYFSAFDNLLCTEVLIHRLSQPLTAEILSEIEIIRRFNHDNIASFYDLVTSALDGSTYIVSEILDTNLENVMYSDQMTFSHATLFSYQIMRGLKYLHSADLCHGSLNPFNILISCHDLLVKISGLQTKDEYLDTESGLCYCSPEKLMKLDKKDTTSMDIWSSACILVEMLLRRKLFRGLCAQDVVLKIIDIIYLSEADWSQVFKLIPNKMLKNHPLKPRQPIRIIFSCWDATVVSLLESMLAFDRDQRMSAEDALSYSFFSEYHSPEDEPTMNEDVMELLAQEKLLLSRNKEKLLCGSYSMDDILNVDGISMPGDQVELNNFRNNLERNSPPVVRTPSPTIMDFLQSSSLQKSTSSHFWKNFRGSPSNVSDPAQNFASPLMEKVWNNSLLSISSSSSCNSVNSISCRPSAKELQHKLKHVSGSDSEKEAAEITDEKLKEDAEINGIVEALRHFKTSVDQSFAPACNKASELDSISQRSSQVSTFVQNLKQNFSADKLQEDKAKICSYLNASCVIQEEQARKEVEKFLVAHGIQVCDIGGNVGSIQKNATNSVKDVTKLTSKEENVDNLKKFEEIEGTWIPSGRKLLLEQIETEKKANLWNGCYIHKKQVTSADESEDYIEVGCKITSSEFDELYRLPTEHLKRDGPSWRRYADDMNHSLTNHHNHHHHFFHNEDGTRSSRLSEGGACGGYDYGSLDDLGPSNNFYNSCTKCDQKISTGPWHRLDFSPEESDGTLKCPVNRVVCNHKKCFTPKVTNTSSDERHPSPDSPPSSPPFAHSHSGARPKKSRKQFRK